MGKIDLNSIIYNESLSRVELFSCLEQEDIYSFYTGEPVVLNINICSPLREDNVPSFGYYYHRDGSGILMFYDFATKDTGDVVKFVSLLFKLWASSLEDCLRSKRAWYNSRHRKEKASNC